jgi:prepilin-type N-terminal cleavage/methylation domain-containing protein
VIARIRRGLVQSQGRRDAGITMIELLVAMMIVVILSTIVIGFYQSTVQSLATANSINRNTEQASNGMNESAREIRAATSNPVLNQPNAPAIVQAANETLVLYAYVGLQSTQAQLPVMVRLRVDPTTRRLMEDIWPATQNAGGYWIFPATTAPPTTTRLLAATVANPTGGTYLFTYMAGTTPVPVGTWTTAQYNSITSIKITLTIQGSLTDATRPVTLQNTVGMPNLNL